VSDTCKHMEFKSFVRVARLEDSGRFNAEVKIYCSDCGVQFRFRGLEMGIDTEGACMSVDGLEARLAICPKDEIPLPWRGSTGFKITSTEADDA